MAMQNEKIKNEIEKEIEQSGECTIEKVHEYMYKIEQQRLGYGGRTGCIRSRFCRYSNLQKFMFGYYRRSITR